jgi:glucosamine-phosphate N-acetyltransferase
MKISKSFKIEPIKKKNLKNVYKILNDNLSNFNPKKKQYDKLWIDYKKNKKLFSVIGVLNNEIIGQGSIVINSTIRGGKIGYIEDIVIKKNFRSLGYGSKIVSELKKISKKKKCYKIIIQTKDNNIAFYKKNQFTNRSRSMIAFLK